jgi:hypothetical protein
MISGSPVAAAASSAESSELARFETALASAGGSALACRSTEPAGPWSSVSGVSVVSVGLDTPQAAASANKHTHIDRFILLSHVE